MPTTIAPRLLVPLHRSLAGLLLIGLLTSHAGGQCQIATLVDGEGASGDGFGGSVSTDGATALVGAPLHDGIAANTGAAPVFLRVGATWTEVGRLTAPDADAGDKFGHAVAIDGVWALIGAPEDDDRGDGAGAAYVFRFDGSAWQPHVKLLAPDGAAGDRFGYSVALHGEVAVAGAYRDDDRGSNSGSAHVFRFDGAAWSEAGKLTANDGNTGDWFGRVVAVHGETVMVGATQDDDHGGSSGSAYVFTDDGSGWAQTQKILPDEAGAGDRFGGAIDLEGTLAVVGAHLDDTHGSNAGTVYVLRRIGGVWSVEAKLFAPGAMPGDRFGSAVAASQGRIAAGAPETDLAGPSAGAVHCFEQSGTAWVDAGTLLPDGAAAGDEFGSAIAMAAGSLTSGAANADAAGVDAGAAFVFAGLLDMDCNGNGMPDDCDIASGASQDSDGDGVPDECTSLFGDVNGDGVVDYEDMTLISGAWGPCPPPARAPRT